MGNLTPPEGSPKSTATIASYVEAHSNNSPETMATAISPMESSAGSYRNAPVTTAVQMEDPSLQPREAAEWANILRSQLSIVASSHKSETDVRSSSPLVNEIVMQAPRRRAANPAVAAMANKIAQLLYPHHSNQVGAIIQYEKDLVTLRNLVVDQRKRVISENTKRNELFDWSKRILKQGAWDPATDLWSLDGAPALPMPVRVAEAESLEPFFEHLALDGTEAKSSTARAAADATEIEEPYYDVKSLEFERGVLYSDRRLDLCKMVLGPTHIESLMESLKTNRFVAHFLLGNNIIGPHGARCIADFVKEFPNRMDTWYLAGNCIDTISCALLVDEWVKSSVVTNIWLKRNPLMPESADDIFRLITETANLRTLDLDQTKLGDVGVTKLFNKLANYTPVDPLSLRHIYLNAVGIGAKGAAAIAEYLALPDCELDAIYAANNPLGNDGVIALAKGLKKNQSLTRLTLNSVVLSWVHGARGKSRYTVVPWDERSKIQPFPSTVPMTILHVLILKRYNFITDQSANAIHSLIKLSPNLTYLNLSRCALTHAGLNRILAVVKGSLTLQYFFAITTHPQERTATAVAAVQEHAKLSKLVHATLEANVERIYGVSYQEFLADYKRWLVNDKSDVRKIDSVYRNRDAGMARRGLKKLDKWWDEGDETLDIVSKDIINHA
ncbi:uncharacterized protein N0V89_007096 [Didymosphaeria variabile]|uniref:RNI-like protein n=1 Tax=Didymosphaeria variabile TaxID=1932322 RepID=A0A9W8XKE6_9PLEO|nr:uncharacterized protein N0V89_007096 [Didymosphaeria variabile]KAJ4351753.1 hypothetical protein N0V89_007096 [Didymosphaeria variabile]